MKRFFWVTSIIVAVSIPLMVAHAEPQISKDWTWDISSSIDVNGGEFVYAGTINSDGRILGQSCYITDGSCFYFVDLGITCETDSQYPSLLNSGKGAVSASLVCGRKLDNGNNVFRIPSFDDVNEIVLSADSVGFAVAIEAGRFKVVRFSLSGSTRAIEMMRMVAEIRQRSSSGSATPRNFSSEEVL